METDPSSEDTATVEVEQVTPEIQEPSILFKTVRLIINIITHILIFITVFVCIVFACKDKLGVFELHIILCVLGYQFFMNQGILALSQYNSWSMHLKKKHRRHVHWILEFIAVALVTTGSVLLILQMETHFDTAHGCLGLLALGASFVSTLNGLFSFFSYKLKSDSLFSWIYLFHGIVGILTVVFSTGSLCVAFFSTPFKIWLSSGWFTDGNLLAIILTVMTALFSVFVLLDPILLCVGVLAMRCIKTGNK